MGPDRHDHPRPWRPAHLWGGSVTERVARQAPCPVLVFPLAFLEHQPGQAE
ncbi:universal stress protein [bacterium]|nr:universal stress protein [bacterium]